LRLEESEIQRAQRCRVWLVRRVIYGVLLPVVGVGQRQVLPVDQTRGEPPPN